MQVHLIDQDFDMYCDVNFLIGYTADLLEDQLGSSYAKIQDTLLDRSSA